MPPLQRGAAAVPPPAVAAAPSRRPPSRRPSLRRSAVRWASGRGSNSPWGLHNGPGSRSVAACRRGLPCRHAAARRCRPAPLQVLGVPKVALLFLTTRRLAHEKLWRLWLWDAAHLLPVQAQKVLQVCGGGAGQALP